MDLSTVSTEELRHELHQREEREARERWDGIAEAHRCPECGSPPEKLEKRAVEEFRFAPRDSDGRPMLFSRYDDPDGTTEGLRHLTTVTCQNGHVTEKEDIEWFREPRKGPPLLPG